jgi:uncharacterized protein (DUF924 family)
VTSPKRPPGRPHHYANGEFTVTPPAYDMNQRARELAALWIKGEHDSVLSALLRFEHARLPFDEIRAKGLTALAVLHAERARSTALSVALYRNLRDAQDKACPRCFGAADLFLALLDARGEGAL